MKRFLPLLAFFMLACSGPKNTQPSEPEHPSYSGLPLANYTVISTDQVQSSGEVPAGSSVTFRSTYNRRNQLTANNTATLTLSGMSGVKIRSITLLMHSNKNAGAGSLIVTNDNTPIWTIDNANFNSSSWNGSYTTETDSIFHIFPTFIVCEDQLQITITASVNSLYIMGYKIEYEPAPEQSRSTTPDTTFISGLKTITIWGSYRLTGAIEEDYIRTKSDTLPITNDDLYYIDFSKDSTATIQHYSGMYIGISDAKVANLATPWSVVFIPEDTTFTFFVKQKDRYYLLQPDPYTLDCFLKTYNKFREQRWTLRSVE